MLEDQDRNEFKIYEYIIVHQIAGKTFLIFKIDFIYKIIIMYKIYQ